MVALFFFFSITLASPNNLRPLSRFQNQPLAVDALAAEAGDDLVGDGLEVAGGEGEDGGARAREADPQEPLLRARRHRLHDFAQPRDQRLPVLLVQLVLHREVDQVRVWRRLAQSDGEQGYALEVERLGG